MTNGKPLFADKDRPLARDTLASVLREFRDGGIVAGIDNTILLRTLSALSTAELSHLDVIEALSSLHRRAGGTLEEFEGAIAERRKAESIGRSGHNKTWTLYLPFNAALVDDVTAATVLRISGVDFSFVRWSDVRPNLHTEDLRRTLEYSIFPKIDERDVASCVTVRAVGKRIEDAWESIVSAFDLMRGALEFAFIASDTTPTLTGDPIGYFATPRVALGVAGEEFNYLSFYTENTGDGAQRRAPRLSQGHLRLAEQATRHLAEPAEEGSTLSAVADALRLYGQAADARLPHRQLLGLWQVAEAVVLSTTFKGDTKTVCRRLVSFVDEWSNIDTRGMPRTLDAIADKRNSIVHRGLHGNTEPEDVVIQKAVCDTAIRWLTRNASRFPTPMHLEEYYRFVQLPSNRQTAATETYRALGSR